MMKLKAGDPIVIRCGDRTVEGVIELASTNSRSLVLAYDAMLAGHAGKMPVLLHDDGMYRSIINGALVSVTKRRLLKLVTSNA